MSLSVLWSVSRSVRRLVRNAFVSAGRDEPANDLFHVYELVFPHLWGSFGRNLAAQRHEYDDEKMHLRIFLSDIMDGK